MGKSHCSEVSEFCLEGRLISTVIKDGYKLKGLLLQTSEGECYVKLAKHLRAAFNLQLQPGTWLQVMGEKKHDLETGEVKLKAQQVMRAGGVGEAGGAGGVNSEPAPSMSVSANAKKATILVCQKSDCMKRGGKEVCQALQVALSDRDLDEQVTIKGTGCMKNCKAGPNLVMPDKTRYSRLSTTQVPALMEQHFATQSIDTQA